MSLATWDPTVLPATRHKRTCPTLPSHAGWSSIYLPRRDGRLSWPSWLDSTTAGSRASDLQRPASFTNFSRCCLSIFISLCLLYGTEYLQTFDSATVNLILRDIWRHSFLTVVFIFIPPDWLLLQCFCRFAYGALQVSLLIYYYYYY